MQQVVGAKVNESLIWQGSCRNNLTSDKVVAETLWHLTRCERGHFLSYCTAVALTFTFHLNCFNSHFLITLQSFSLSNYKYFLITLNNGEKKLRCGSSLEQTNIRQRMPFIVLYFFPFSMSIAELGINFHKIFPFQNYTLVSYFFWAFQNMKVRAARFLNSGQEVTWFAKIFYLVAQQVFCPSSIIHSAFWILGLPNSS